MILFSLNVLSFIRTRLCTLFSISLERVSGSLWHNERSMFAVGNTRHLPSLFCPRTEALLSDLPPKTFPNAFPKQTCLLPECQLVMSAGRALVNRGAERSIKLEMYSCAWRYTPTQGDKSSSSQPEARIRSGTREREASHTKPMVMQNLFHINLTSFPSA